MRNFLRVTCAWAALVAWLAVSGLSADLLQVFAYANMAADNAFAHLLFAALALSACVGGGDAPAEQGVRVFLSGVFDRPDSRLRVPSVAFAGDHAVAGWLQDGRGGRTLLKRSADGWEFVVCGGEELRTAAGLCEAGLPFALVEPMAQAVQASEASLPAHQRATLGDFKGLMKMDGAGHSPPKR